VKLIAGLGNPGARYAQSRHNVGFMVVDELARRWHTEATRHDRKFDALVGEAQAAQQRILLLKPVTYMNLSGRSVSAAARYFKIPTPEILVVHDDLDLTLGQLRIRATGSAGGHKGLADVLRHFHTDEVPRLRIGIGKVHRQATVAHVLGAFNADEREVITETVTLAADAAACWLERGVEAAMNAFNRRRDNGSPGGSRLEGESS
jgi:PTH1 family peptidyl-tRNA hydrolase